MPREHVGDMNINERTDGRIYEKEVIPKMGFL